MVALGAAYLLVLQFLLTGLALGTHAAPSLAAATQGVICLGMGTGGSTPDAPTAPPHVPDCCQLGCLMGTALAPSPRITVATALPSDAASSSYMTPTSVVRGDQGWRRPHNSRAPPIRA